jgi:hypothetical protein
MYGAAAVLAGSLILLIVIESRAHRTPLSVGATAEEAWTYIHSPAAWETRGFLLDIKRRGWKAQQRDIQCDVRYYIQLKTNHLFATRHVVYLLGTNGVITGVKSDWKWVSPF